MALYSCNHVMPTTTLECYTAGTYNYNIYTHRVDSQYHDPQGSVYGPPGSVSREVDPIGLEGLGLKGLLGLLVVGRDVKKKIFLIQPLKVAFFF